MDIELALDQGVEAPQGSCEPATGKLGLSAIFPPNQEQMVGEHAREIGCEKPGITPGREPNTGTFTILDVNPSFAFQSGRAARTAGRSIR